MRGESDSKAQNKPETRDSNPRISRLCMLDLGQPNY